MGFCLYASKNLMTITDRNLFFSGHRFRFKRHLHPRELALLADRIRSLSIKNGKGGSQLDLFIRGRRIGQLVKAIVPRFRPKVTLQGIRILRTIEIISIISGVGDPDFGEFGIALYQKAYQELVKRKKIRTEISRGSVGFEKLFSHMVAEIIDEFRDEWTRKKEFTYRDELFWALTRDEPLPEQPGTGSSVRSIPSLRLFPLEVLERIEEQGDIMLKPLIRLGRSMRVPCRKIGGKSGGKPPRRKKGQGSPTLGYYWPLKGGYRAVHDLTPFTIYGLAIQSRALEREQDLTVVDFARLGHDACEFRRDMGLGGADIIAETAELYIRILRGLRLMRQEVEKLGPDQLRGVVVKAVQKHRLDAPWDR
jgi:hypothetical protein